MKIKIQAKTTNPKNRVHKFKNLVGPSSGNGFHSKTSNKVAEIELYDEIGFWGVTAKQFKDTLVRAEKDGVNEIKLRINSPGGDVFDGIAMYNDLVDFKGKVHVEIVGLAASAASLVAMAGDTISMKENAMIMIHNAWTIAIGNKADMRSTADVLEVIDSSLAKTYVSRTGLSLDEVTAMLDAETWLDADEALEKNFIDTIADDNKEDDDSAKAVFDLSVYNNVPVKVKRDIEASLCDAGYSRSEAKAAVSKGFQVLEQRDAVPNAKTPEQREVVTDNTELLASLDNCLKTLTTK